MLIANDFIFYTYMWNFCECIISFLCSIGILTIVSSPRWACCGLSSLFLLGFTLFSKCLPLIYGTLWLFNQQNSYCISDAPVLHKHAVNYLLGNASCYIFELVFGCWFLFSCGLSDAIVEATAQYEHDVLLEKN